MGLEFKLKVFGREYEGKPFFKRVSLNNTYKYLHITNALYITAYKVFTGFERSEDYCECKCRKYNVSE